ncbi:MAG: DUF86 domain-containing protein [Planctomycetota bacterium]
MKDDRLYLEQILEAVEKILSYVAGGREEFMRNSLVQDGVIRNFEIIGEAPKQLSEETRCKQPEIPWSDVARFRDILIHHYMGVNLTRVWKVIEGHLPALRRAIDELLR